MPVACRHYTDPSPDVLRESRGILVVDDIVHAYYRIDPTYRWGCAQELLDTMATTDTPRKQTKWRTPS